MALKAERIRVGVARDGRDGTLTSPSVLQHHSLKCSVTHTQGFTTF